MRTKAFLHGSERATVGALQEALTHQGVPVDVVELEEGGFKTGRVQLTIEPKSNRRRLQAYPLQVIGEARQCRADRFRFGRNLRFADVLAVLVHNAKTRAETH